LKANVGYLGCVMFDASATTEAVDFNLFDPTRKQQAYSKIDSDKCKGELFDWKRLLDVLNYGQLLF